ncbi:MAG: hypothetical protein JSV14_01920 [Deltaproteobacteria bacterium]|nr:MAG: hypothetical protein JSV14_01920 [Deltaproteobacteria bacterium]
MKYSSREDIVVLVIFVTIGLIVPGVVVLRHFIGIDPMSFLNIKWGRTVLGFVFTLLATGVCLLNFYLTLLVPWLYKRRHGSMADFAHMSGLPLVGGFFILCAGALMPPSVPLGIYLLLLYVIDGNGFPCFFVSVIGNGV